MKKYWLEPDVLEFELEYIEKPFRIWNIVLIVLIYFNTLYGESRLVP